VKEEEEEEEEISQGARSVNQIDISFSENTIVPPFTLWYVPPQSVIHAETQRFSNGSLKGFVVLRRTITYWRTIVSSETPL